MKSTDSISTAPRIRTVYPAVQQLLSVPRSWPPTLLVVVDAEEEFDWNAPFNPHSKSVTNIALQGLSQDVLDQHRVVPTYVIDYPVASTPEAISVFRHFMDEGRCEIGAHLHPWVNPPAEGPVDVRHSYPGNLPAALEREKLIALTNTIISNFAIQPKIYKAGRYGIGVATPEILRALNYTVDVSVVPHTDFSDDGGPDFRNAPSTPFMIANHLCELPLSVHFVGSFASVGARIFPLLQSAALQRFRLGGVCGRLGLLERLRLSPEGHTLADMIRQTRSALRAGTRLFMLTYHSSSLLPGATAYVRTNEERSAFLATLDGYLQFFLQEIGGRADTVRRIASELAPRE
jgi:hypothetical protein